MDQHEFVRRALSLVGQSYGECDCIGVVRKAANIKCQGTNWLWRSIFNSPKYRYLFERSVKPLSPDQYIRQRFPPDVSQPQEEEYPDRAEQGRNQACPQERV